MNVTLEEILNETEDIHEDNEEFIRTPIKTNDHRNVLLPVKKSKIQHEEPSDKTTKITISRDVQLISIEPGTIEDDEGYLLPCVNIWGRSSIGRSVQLTCTGFYPYFYFETGFKVSEEELTNITLQLEDYFMKHRKNDSVRRKVINVEQILDKSSLIGYTEVNSVFIKVTLCLPQFIASSRDFIEKSDDFIIQGRSHFKTFESAFQYILRWIIDNGACGGGWIEFNPEDSEIKKGTIEKTSSCDDEFIIDSSKVSCKSKDERSDHSSLRLFSFDIECAARPGQFPEATRDKVIQIAVTTEVFQKSKETNHTTIFVLGSCHPISGRTVKVYEKEEDLLLGFRDFIIYFDPDIVMGYNINNFDWPYLIKRAQTLGVDDFSILGRRTNIKSKCISAKFESKAHGKRDSFETNLFGRWTIDLFQEMQRNHKLRSYTLNNVSQQFLGEQKEDVHHSQITPLFNGSKEDRTTLAKYCVKDAELPLKLFHQQMLGFNYMEMSRVTLVPPSFITNRGQAIKVMCQIYSMSKVKHKLVPKEIIVARDSTYEGATVFNPVKGFYKVPIATLDFASLYPSIMIRHNLCYSTLVKKPNEKTYTTPIDAHFIEREHYEGLLPLILKTLLAQRKKAKWDLAKEEDPQKKAVLDGRQLALKISANSVYGFTGATVGRLPCFEISASVTSIGRDMIKRTAELVCEKYSRRNGFEHDTRVIYGDTDSVMVNFGVETVEEALELGKEAAAYITKTLFEDPVKLEFEKVYFPYLLISKKRYAGFFWTKVEKYDKLDAKGIESVRRDNCMLLSRTVKECIQLLLEKQSPELAADYVRNVIKNLLMSEVNISDLVITKKLSKNPEEYDTKSPHVQLAMKLFERDPKTAPRVGDRVPYILMKGHKNQKATDLAEDPLYVVKQGLDIDYNKYIENCFRKPLERIFGVLMPNTESLFQGDHTSVLRGLPKPCFNGFGKRRVEVEYDEDVNNNDEKKKKKKTTKDVDHRPQRKHLQQSSILSFFAKQERCRICKNVTNSKSIVCKGCSGKTKELREKMLQDQRKINEQIDKMEEKCFKCSGKRNTLDSCNSVDCQQFYSRFLGKYKLANVLSDLEKLSF